MTRLLQHIITRAVLLFTEHWPALGAALVTTLIVSGPVIAFPFVAGEAYRGINISRYGDDEHYYMTRMNEALAGHALGQPFLREGKDEQNAIFSYVEPALALPLWALGLAENMNAAAYVNILNGVGVFAVVLLMYAFTLRLTNNRFISVGAALFAVLGYSIIETKSLFFSGTNIYGRSFFPFASSVPFFAFLIALYDSLVSERRYAWVVAGVLAGLLMYAYFYAWTFAYAMLLALGVIFLLLGDWRSLLTVCRAGILGVALGAYNLMELFRFQTSPESVTVSFFQAHTLGRAAVMSKIGLGTISLAAVHTYLRERDRTTYFVWALIAAGWIALNQQLVSGRIVQYGHYYWYFIVPLSVFIGSYFFARIFPQRLHAYFAAVLVALALFAGVGQQYRSFLAQYPAKLSEQRYAPVLAVLNEDQDGVVLTAASGETDVFLATIYTPHDLYWIPAASIYAYPEGRLQEALELHLYLNKDARKDPVGYLERALAKGVSAQNTYVNLYIDLEGLRSGHDYYGYQRILKAGEVSFGGLRERLMKEIVSDYETRFRDPERLRTLLKERNVRYVLWDRENYPEWDLSVLGHIEELVSSDGLVLYRL